MTRGERLAPLDPKTPVLVAVGLVFFLFAVLLNSVGPVIMQAIASFGVTKTQASLVEGVKDLSIAFSSFFVALVLPRLGYRRGIVISLLAVAAACAAVPLLGAFWAVRLLFLVVGMAFALVKTGVYVIVGITSSARRSHASVTSTLEGVFMLGVVSSFWLFGLFIDPRAPSSTFWLNVYWCLAVAALFLAVLIALAPLDENSAKVDDVPLGNGLLAMPRLLANPLVAVFLACAFLDVLVEQSLNSWLPMFNREVLKLSPTPAVLVASLYPASVAAGRLGAGVILKRIPWIWLVIAGLLAAGAVLAGVMPLMVAALGPARGSALPLVAFLVPAVGLMVAPIYPVLCSSVLSALPLTSQSSMTALILIASALGGTLGSLVTGRVFAVLDGKTAFAGIVVPMFVLATFALWFDRLLKRAAST